MSRCTHLDTVAFETVPEPVAGCEATGHPIIRSAEPGEDWSWCYEDELMFRLR